MTPQEALEPIQLILQWLFVFAIYAMVGLSALVFLIHVLGLVGIGKGTPWTKTPDKE